MTIPRTARSAVAICLGLSFITVANAQSNWLNFTDETVTRIVADPLVPLYSVPDLGVAGTPAECAKSLEAYLAAGLQEPVIQVGGTDEEKTMALDVIRQFTGG